MSKKKFKAFLSQNLFYKALYTTIPNIDSIIPNLRIKLEKNVDYWIDFISLNLLHMCGIAAIILLYHDF